MNEREQFLYHIVPDSLVGDVLLPLNELTAIAPETAAEAATKYRGRESLRAVCIPRLNCAWNDVLHLAPLHPSKTKAAMLACGFNPKPLRFFMIPPARLQPQQALNFRNSRDTQGLYDFLEEDFFEFSRTSYIELEQVPQAQAEYFARMKSAGQPPLLWARTPHVFYRGRISVRDLRIIEW